MSNASEASKSSDRNESLLFHGTSSELWKKIKKDKLLKRAPSGDQCVSLTSDYKVARYFAEMSCKGDAGGTPVILKVNAEGLNAQSFSSAVWGERECDWEAEIACWDDIPLSRVELLPAAKAVRYDAIAYRIERDGVLVAMTLQLGNGLWSLNDMEEKKIGKRNYKTPKEAAAAFDALLPAVPRFEHLEIGIIG